MRPGRRSRRWRPPRRGTSGGSCSWGPPVGRADLIRPGTVRPTRPPPIPYVRASIEELPAELTGVADQVTAILPWGSLLAAFARPVVPLLQDVRRLCAPGAALTVVLGVDPQRDRAEVLRLGLPVLDVAHFAGALASGYAEAGFVVTSVRALAPEELARWASSWAKRLAFGHPRPVFQIEARAF